MDDSSKTRAEDTRKRPSVGPIALDQVDLDFLTGFEFTDFEQAYRWAVLSGSFGLASIDETGRPFLEVLTDKGHTWLYFSRKGRLKKVRTYQA
jgi:hypothetical protein